MYPAIRINIGLTASSTQVPMLMPCCAVESGLMAPPISSPIPDHLHLLPKLRIGLAVSDPHLFKEHIARVKHAACIPRIGTLLSQKIIQHLTLDLPPIFISLRDLAQKSRLRNARLA